MPYFFRRASVSGRLLLVLLPMVMFFVAGTAWLAVMGSEKIADRNATQYGEDLAESQVSVIALPVHAMQVTVDNLALAVQSYAASGGGDRRFIADLVRTPLAKQADFVAGIWFYSMPDVFGADAEQIGRDVSVADPKTGRMLTYYVRVDGRQAFEAAIPDFETKPFWSEPSRSLRPYSGPPYLYPIFGQERLLASYAVPIVVDGKLVGVVGADMDLRKAADFLETLRPAGGRVLSVNLDGVWIQNPYAELAGTPVRVGDDPQTEMPAGELEALKAGRSYVAEKTGPSGERVRRVAVPLPFYEGENRRMLMIDFPLETLLAPYKDVRLAILVGGLLSALAIAVAVFVAVPALIGNPLQGLRRSIEDLKAGHLSKPVMATERSDDIGAIAQAIDSFRKTLIDQRRLEREKAELQGQVLQQQKMEAIGLLAGGIAHDFNNLIGVILGYLGFISDDAPPGSAPRNYAEQAARAGNRAKDMIRQLLSFARPSVGGRSVVVPDVVVREATMLLRTMLPSSIALDIDVADGLPAIRVDQTQMIQVLMNLCINASDAFVNKAGLVSLRVRLSGQFDRHDETGEWPSFVALGSAAPQVPCVTFEVRDDAGGIASENLPRLFEPFYTTKSAGKGTGMGLAIVYGVIHAHGGTLEVRSKRGVGTLFRFSIPATPDKPAELPVVEPTRQKTVPRRVLIVDDEQEMGDMLEEGLSRFGHEVAICEDADEAQAVFEENPHAFDVVLTDQTMPGMAGVDLIRRLKRRRPDLPCILYTGYSDNTDNAALMASGADALLFKPVSPAAVNACIAEVLGKVPIG